MLRKSPSGGSARAGMIGDQHAVGRGYTEEEVVVAAIGVAAVAGLEAAELGDAVHDPGCSQARPCT
jgi:hypothetical protein